MDFWGSIVCRIIATAIVLHQGKENMPGSDGSRPGFASEFKWEAALSVILVSIWYH